MWSADFLQKNPDRAELKRPAPEGGSPPPGDSLSEPRVGMRLAVKLVDMPDWWLRWFPAGATTEGTQEEHWESKKGQEKRFQITLMKHGSMYCTILHLVSH